MDKIKRGVYPLLVARWEKVLDTVLRAASDAIIDFGELCTLLKALGFDERIRGDHHIFSKTGVSEIINLQPSAQIGQGEAVPGEAGPQHHHQVPARELVA